MYRAPAPQARPAAPGPRHPAPSLDAATPLRLGALAPLPRGAGRPTLGGRQQVGVHRTVRSGTLTGDELLWIDAPAGGQAALVAASSDGAHGLRMAVRFASLPAGSEIRFYAPDEPAAPETFGAATLAPTAGRVSRPGDRDPIFWSPVVTGAAMVLEVWTPAGSPLGDLRFTVQQVAHLYRPILEPRHLSGIGASGACNRDIACDPRWQTTADSVAKYIFADGNASFLCTGQLLADTDATATPYFLTAAHCVSKRRVARSMTFFWFFQRAQCDGADPSEVVQTASGARLLVTTGGIGEGKLTTDHTLVRIRRPRRLPDGVTFSGWSARDADTLARKRVQGIHHPSGDVKMSSLGKGQGLVQVDEAGVLAPGAPHTHYGIVWRKGTTEGGSSGSGIWFGRRWPNQYLIGVLTGGFASCSAPQDPDFYGRFDKTFMEQPRLRKFLTGKRVLR